MSGSIPTGTLAHGSVFMCLEWHDQPLHSEPALIFELPLTDGILAFLVLENRLVVEIGRVDASKEEITDQWITPELIRQAGARVIVSLQWSNGRISTFRLNSCDVPRSDAADEFFIGHYEDALPTEDQSISSEQCISDLAQKRAPMSLAFMQLEQWTKRLEAHLENQRNNTPELVFEIANCLRTLLCGAEKNGGSLLSKCAREIEFDLVCYTAKGLEEDVNIPFMDETTIFFGCIPAAAPISGMQVETDLQTWLSMLALVTVNHRIKHWELIREVADKYGSHADTGGEVLSLSFMNPHRAGLNLGILDTIIRGYGKFALVMSKRLIGSHGMKFSAGTL